MPNGEVTIGVKDTAVCQHERMLLLLALQTYGNAVYDSLIHSLCMSA
jgi:hypothetical protein